MDNILKYAGFWRRFMASVIDGFVLMIPSYAVVFLIGFPFNFFMDTFEKIESGAVSPEYVEELRNNMPETITRITLAILAVQVIWWLYFAIMESSTLQATLGKMAMGSIVTDLDGRGISFLRATGRHFGKFLSHLIFQVGFIMAGFTEKKQALHDMLAGCLVIQCATEPKALFEMPD
ncbi:RDD family protein [bacterium]|nr:RDD family protein [bacterium]